MQFPLKGVVPISFLTLAFLFCCASYGRQYQANPAVRFSFASVQDACGPTDAPAVEFYFTLKQGQSGEYEEPFVMISINENLPSSAPQDYAIGSGRNAVLASRCLSRGRCDNATSGTLHLTTFRRGKGASGEYQLHFQDGKKDSFDATWHVVRQLTCR
jgi:hypothetical protein